MRSSQRILWAIAACVACGCGAGEAPTVSHSETHEPSSTAPVRETAVVGGDVVATVDGEPIRLREVEARAREARITPAAALRRIEEELVLAHLAEASSVAGDPEVEAAARRASVRELLHRDIEASRTPEGVPDAVVEARHAQIGGALSQPETRRATHVLVPLPTDAEQARVDAASRAANEILHELEAEAAPSGAMDRFAGRRGAFEITVEHLDPMRRDALDGPFADALFEAEAPGLLRHVVRSSYGFHVIALVEVVPPWEVPVDEWMPVVRRQLAAEARAEATEALAMELAARTPVLINETAAHAAETFPFGGETTFGASGTAVGAEGTP